MADRVLTPGQKVVRLGEWLRLTQEQLADVLGVTRGTVSAYKQRQNANPSIDKLKTLSFKVGIPVSWFLDGQDNDPPVPRSLEEAEKLSRDGQVTSVVRERQAPYQAMFATNAEVVLPVWRNVTAGYDQEAGFTDEEMEPPMAVPAFFVSGEPPERFVVCLPSGVSMSPRIVQGDVVIARLNPNPPPNSIVVAKRPDGINFLKVFRIEQHAPTLHSINGKFPVISPLDDWMTRGVVVGIWKPYVLHEPNIEFNAGAPLRA